MYRVQGVLLTKGAFVRRTVHVSSCKPGTRSCCVDGISSCALSGEPFSRAAYTCSHTLFVYRQLPLPLARGHTAGNIPSAGEVRTREGLRSLAIETQLVLAIGVVRKKGVRKAGCPQIEPVKQTRFPRRKVQLGHPIKNPREPRAP